MSHDKGSMKLIMENWDSFVSDDKPSAVDVFYEADQRIEKRQQQTLNEILGGAIDVTKDEEGNMEAHISPMGKWAALTAMTGITFLGLTNIVALTAPPSVALAFFLQGGIVPLMIFGGLTYVYFKVKKAFGNVFKKFGRKRDPLTIAQGKVKKIVNTMKKKFDVSDEQAVAVLDLINEEVRNDKECRKISEDLLQAIEDEDSDQTLSLTDQLDSAMNNVIMRLQSELRSHMQSSVPANEKEK